MVFGGVVCFVGGGAGQIGGYFVRLHAHNHMSIGSASRARISVIIGGNWFFCWVRLGIGVVVFWLCFL